jgi:hypothetical protein
MALQLFSQSLGRTVREDVDRAAPLLIDKDGAIAMASAEGEVVKAEHPWCLDRLVRSATDQAQQGRSTDGHAQPVDQALPGLAAEGESNQANDLGQAIGAPRVGYQQR